MTPHREKARQRGWGQAYHLFYRFVSPSAHAGDVTQHLTLTEDGAIIKLAPTDELIEQVAESAAGMLWEITQTVNDRLGLNYLSRLESVRPRAVSELLKRRADRAAARGKVSAPSTTT